MSKRSGLLWVCFFAAACTSYGQNYDASLIPAELRAHTHAVTRMEELKVLIKSQSKAVITHKYAVTILDEQGDGNAGYSNYYNSLQDLDAIEGTLYDAQGKKLKTVKRKDIEDLPAADGFSLALDARLKIHNFHCRQYPYTVEYSDQVTQKHTFHLPSWRPAPREYLAIEQSRFIVETPPGYQLRYKQLNYADKPVITTTPVTSYSWEVKNQPSRSEQAFAEGEIERATAVLIGPSDFSLGNYTGDMRTWRSFGRFVNELNRGRDELPDNVKQEVHRLVDSITDRDEKIRRLYKYMQGTTHYISIQIGIGGWQPYDAKYVAAHRYGDCKALSNYMISLLKEAGITANYVLINAGNIVRGVVADFPTAEFNHAICCVPSARDTMWLECTSQISPAGFLGSFTGNRTALLVNEDGGHIVRTPRYRSHDNMQTRSVIAVIDANGNMSADIHTSFTGVKQEARHSLIHRYSPDEMRKYLNRCFEIPTYEVDRSAFEETATSMPVLEEKLHLTAPGYASVSGRRLFIVPNFVNRWNTRISEEANRGAAIVLPDSYTDADTIHISVPEGFKAEAIPKDVQLETPFGKYSVTYKVRDNTVDVTRILIRERKTLLAGLYPALVKYYDDMFRADHSRMVFVKKDE